MYNFLKIMLNHKIKLVTLTLTIVIASIFILNKPQPKKLFYIKDDESFKVEIPHHIAKSKDCAKYKEWVHNNFTPMLISSDRCPWTKPPKGETGKFIMNGIKLNIPRNYFLFDKNEPDGENDHITLLMKYPEMIPNDDINNRDYNVMVSIKNTQNWSTCRDLKKCNEIGQERYDHLTNIDLNKERNIPNKIKKFKELSDEKLTGYIINDSGQYLVRGNPLKPSYWLLCDGGEYEKKKFHPSCETYFNYNDKIYLDYHFSKHFLLKHHDDLRKKIIEKMTEFQK